MLYSLLFLHSSTRLFRARNPWHSDNYREQIHSTRMWHDKNTQSATSLSESFSAWRKIFPALYSTNWPNFIAWLTLCLEILGNMFIVRGLVRILASNFAKSEANFINRKMILRESINLQMNFNKRLWISNKCYYHGYTFL